MTQQQVLESIKEHVSYAKQYFDVVQFSPEDATRTDTDFLIKCVQMAVDCGATIINIQIQSVIVIQMNMVEFLKP